MYTCEFCKQSMPGNALYCGSCGRKRNSADDNAVTGITPVDGVQTINNSRHTPAPDWALDNQPGVSASSVSDDEDVERELLASYEDDEDEETLPQQIEKKKDDEEDDDKFVLPFVPPWSQSAPTNPPLQGRPIAINSAPYASPARVLSPHTPPPTPHTPPPVSNTPQAVPNILYAPATPPAHHAVYPGSLPTPTTHKQVTPQRPTSPKPTCLMVVIIAFIISSVLTLVLVGIWFGRQVTASPPVAHLIGVARHGQRMIVQGDHFSPDSKVLITIDAPLTPQGRASLANSASLAVPFLSSATTAGTGGTGTTAKLTQSVDSNGSFTISFLVNPLWSAGSQHNVYVYDQGGDLINILPFGLPSESTQVGLLGCVGDGSPIMLGPVVAGTTQPISKMISLCRQGTGPLDWTANWDKGQKWLQVAPSGHIAGTQPGQLKLQGLPAGLQPGSYTTNVVFSSTESLATVSRTVILQVVKTIAPPITAPTTQPQSPAQPCLTASPGALSFDALEQQSNTLYNTVAVSNCGDSGTLTATAQSDGNWLSIGSLGGTLVGGGMRSVVITASGPDLKAGTYNGQITFALGASSAVVPVQFTVHSHTFVTSCLNVNTSPLVFNGSLGQTPPPTQYVTLTNCGSDGHLSVAENTNDGVSWLGSNIPTYDFKAGSQQRIAINVSSTNLSTSGSYQGNIVMNLGTATVQINVVFNVQGSCLTSGAPPLYFSAVEGQNATPASATVSIENCGALGTWYASPVMNNGTDWLSLGQTSRAITPGETQNVSVNVASKQLKVGNYTGQVLILLGSSTVSVRVTLIVKPPTVIQHPCISVDTSELSFSSYVNQNPEAQTATVSNCGGIAGQLNVTSSAKWIMASVPPGTLGVNGYQDVQVKLSTAGLTKGDYSGTLTFNLDGDTQVVTIHLTVATPTYACVGVGRSEIDFTQVASGGGLSAMSVADSSVQVSNCGDAGVLTSQVAGLEGGDTSWLNFKGTGGQLAAGQGAQQGVSLNTAQTSKLSQGTYSALITFTIKVGSVTDQKTVTVRLNVQSATIAKSQCQATPSSLTFNSAQGKAPEGAQGITFAHCSVGDTLAETNDSGHVLSVSANSLSVNSDGYASISVNIPGASYKAGTYTYVMTFTTGAGASVRVPVTWNVSQPENDKPCLSASSPSFYSEVVAGRKSSIDLHFSDCGSAMGRIQVGQSNSGWLTVLTQSGSIDGSSAYQPGSGPTVSANIDTTNMTPGVYKGSITSSITTDSGSQPLVVPVTLKVDPAQAAAPDSATASPTTAPTQKSQLVPTTGTTPTGGSTPTTGSTPTSGTTPTVGSTPTTGSTPTSGTTPTTGSTPTTGTTPTTGSTPTATTAPAVTTVPTATNAPVRGAPVQATPTPTPVPPTPTPTPVPPTPTPTPVPPTPTPTPVPPTPTPTPTPLPTTPTVTATPKK